MQCTHPKYSMSMVLVHMICTGMNVKMLMIILVLVMMTVGVNGDAKGATNGPNPDEHQHDANREFRPAAEQLNIHYIPRIDTEPTQSTNAHSMPKAPECTQSR